MRLININTFAFEEFEHDPPPYAILSHVWTKEEVTYKDFNDKLAQHKQGFRKIKGFCHAVQQSDGPVAYVWVDTCCIDKSSSAELAEAINSMYKWYRDAQGGCYVYLFDVTSPSDLHASKWFTRGWTLQELIAPVNVKFFNNTWKTLGTKQSLSLELSQFTKIEHRVLINQMPVSACPVAVRMSWAASRSTTRPEDEAYCLLGIFDVNMPLLYGEGSKAFLRLQQEVVKQSSDHSIFYWGAFETSSSELVLSVGMLATSARAFANIRVDRPLHPERVTDGYNFTNTGLSIKLELFPITVGLYRARLRCCQLVMDPNIGFEFCFIFLRSLGTDIFERVCYEGCSYVLLDGDAIEDLQTQGRTKFQRIMIQDVESSRHFRSVKPVYHGIMLQLYSRYDSFIATRDIRLHEGMQFSSGFLPLPPRRLGTIAAVQLQLYRGRDNRVHEVVVKIGFDVSSIPYCEILHQERDRIETHSLLALQNLYDDTWIAGIHSTTGSPSEYFGDFSAPEYQSDYACESCGPTHVIFVGPDHVRRRWYGCSTKKKAWTVLIGRSKYKLFEESYDYWSNA